MISIRKYLQDVAPDEVSEAPARSATKGSEGLASAALDGYRSALQAMGDSSAEACPALGEDLRKALAGIREDLSRALSGASIAAADSSVRERLRDWGAETARHYQKKAGDVRHMLLAMARTAESVGERDQRCARQMNEVTSQLMRIVNLEDLTQIRASIEKSAAELKTSIDRMTAEGEAAIRQLRSQVSTYQAKLEEAEQIASRDALTHLFSRSWVECQIEDRIGSCAPFCTAILDIDGFKCVNDKYGHLVGDELLKQFALELRAACRATDVIGRWGGDEFIVLLDCRLPDAKGQIERVREWICGNYTVAGNSGSITMRMEVSIGVAEIGSGETMKQLLDRADADMYLHKAEARDRARAGVG